VGNSKDERESASLANCFGKSSPFTRKSGRSEPKTSAFNRASLVEILIVDIALRLKLFRIAANINQRQVAKELGVSANFVSMLERGKRDPTLKYLQAFASLVGVPVSALLWEPAQSAERSPEVQMLHERVAGLMAQFATTLGCGRD